MPAPSPEHASTTLIRKDAELIERFLDYLIDPNECIDTYGCTYIDDIEHILMENHHFNFTTQRFPDKEAQEWFEKICSEMKFHGMEDLISHIRAHIGELDLANRRPRSTFHTETIYVSEPAFQKLKQEGDSMKNRIEFQRAMGVGGVASLPTLDAADPDRYELYMGSDRTNPWTYVLKRELARGFLKPDDPVISIGNRWIGEIAYFRENLGLRNTKGLDLFTNDPDLVVAADMHDMPFENDSIKLVFNRGLINKSYDVRILVKEVMRVLKKDGMFIVETPGPYDYGVSRLGCTDIKSSRNLLRLFEGKVRRIFYIEATKPHRYLYDATKLVRLGFQIQKDGWNGAPEIEPFFPPLFNLYNACRQRYLKRDDSNQASRMWAKSLNAFSEVLISETFNSMVRPLVRRVSRN